MTPNDRLRVLIGPIQEETDEEDKRERCIEHSYVKRQEKRILGLSNYCYRERHDADE
jgi:hypothetical protein